MREEFKSPYCRLTTAATKRHQQRVFRIQEKLYRRATEDLSFRLYSGHLMMDPDFLWRSWELRSKANGAPGLDKRSIEMVRQMGPDRFLRQIRRELRNGLYRPQPYALDWKDRGPNKAPRELRRGSLKDKIVAGAAELVYGPVLMADVLPSCYPVIGREPHDAVDAIRKAMERGRYVVYGDITDFYPNIRIDWLLSDLRKRIADNGLLDLIGQWARAYAVDYKNKRVILPGNNGIPQGAVTSPLWAAYYLTQRFDRPFHAYGWDREFGATLIRYADNIWIVCQRKPSTLAARMELLLCQHELHIKETRVVRVSDDIPVLGFLLRKGPSGVTASVEPAREDNLHRKIRRSHEEWKKSAGRQIRGWSTYYEYAGDIHEQDLELETILRRTTHGPA